MALLMTVECICAPDGSGWHPIEVAIEDDDKQRLIVRRIRTPCPLREADAVARLGGLTCISTIDIFRRELAGSINVSPDSVRGSWPLLWSQAVVCADRLRAARHSCKPEHHNNKPHLLLAARVLRCWPDDLAPRPTAARVLASGVAVKVELHLQGGSAFFSFGRGHGAEPVANLQERWRLLEANHTARTIPVREVERALDELLPAPVVHGARIRERRLYEKELFA
jgi:hypothetical protein